MTASEDGLQTGDQPDDITPDETAPDLLGDQRVTNPYAVPLSVLLAGAVVPAAQQTATVADEVEPVVALGGFGAFGAPGGDGADGGGD